MDMRKMHSIKPLSDYEIARQDLLANIHRSFGEAAMVFSFKRTLSDLQNIYELLASGNYTLEQLQRNQTNLQMLNVVNRYFTKSDR